MPETTNVWVQSSALELAVTGHAKKETKRGLPTDCEEEGYVDWGWVYASVKEVKEGEAVEITVKDEDCPHHGVTIKLPGDSIKTGNILMGNRYVDEEGFQEGDDENADVFPDDLITLTHLHEAEVVHCLRNRYGLDKIYTSTGPILLALNPFKNCKALYSDKVMKAYWQAGEQRMKGLRDDDENGLGPHVYGIADHSFRTMMKTIDEQSSGATAGRRQLGGALQKTCDQSILVSGESGAGKTVTTKFIMQYLATLSQRSGGGEPSTVDRQRSTNSISRGGGGKTIEQQVLQSNPILESFGNARTIRNDNSSRFGKFIEIKFSKTGTLVGASIETYLLEKVRLMSQAEGERNYHIFYELFSMPEEELSGFHLQDYTVEDFRMTNQSGTYDRRDGVEDYETFEDLKGAMETMSISEEQQKDAVMIAAASLHASNIGFIEVSADESALDDDNPHLENFTELMGINRDALEKALCYLKIKAGKEFHQRKLSAAKAEKGMEAFIKAFYGALFSFLVKRINDSITVKDKRSRGPTRRGASSGSSNPTIGVLDIFGFESFKQNSFEQLCINYCNEALQQQFNLFVLKNEQAEYEKEGIEWAFISFPDNQDVLDLIDKKGSGIIAILDDQCRAPGTTDKTFVNDLYKKCTGHARFSADFRQVGARKFGVKHYAGPVEYSTEGFVEKNRDELPKEATELLLSSSKEIVQQLGAIIKDPPQASTVSRSMSPARRNGASSKVTVGGQFSRQLHELRRKIDLTTPHYVRCLKPNDLLVPDHFNPLIITDQLRYAGVIEAVRVSRVGYPHRYSHAAFVTRYRILELAALKKAQRASKRTKPVEVLTSAVSTRVWKIQCEEDGFNEAEEEKKSDEAPSLISVGIQVGKTKVFLRRRAFEILEQLRRATTQDAVIQIQRIGLGYILRREYKTTRRNLILVQSLVRQQAAKAHVHEVRLNYRATRIQTVFRRAEKRKEYLTTKAVAKWIQRVQRGRKGRKRYEELNRIRKSIAIQKYWRRHTLQELFKRKMASILTLQCAIRCCFARRAFKSLRLTARDLDAAVAERDQLRSENQKLRSQMDKVNAKLRQMEKAEANSASTEELKAAQKKVAELEKALKESQAIAQKAQKDSEKYSKRSSEMKATLAKADSALQAMQTESKTIKGDLQRTKEKLSTVEKAFVAKEAELKDSKARVKKLEKMTGNHASEMEEMRQSLDQKVNNLKQELSAAKEDLDRQALEMMQMNDDKNRMKKELDKRRKDIDKHRKEVERLTAEVEEARTVSVASNTVPEASIEELDYANKTIEKLEEKLEKKAKASKIQKGLAEKAQAEVKAVKKQSKEAMAKAEKEIEDLKAKLKEALYLSKETAKMALPETPTENDAVAEEILTLQDEISRLNKELASQSNEDPNSPEALAKRYDELRRLAEAGLEKDKEIATLRARLEAKLEERSQDGDPPPKELSNNSEAESLREYIASLQRELTTLREENERGRSHDRSSFISKGSKGSKGSSALTERETKLQEEVYDLEDKVNDKEVEIEALREVNEMLRVDVEKSRKRMKELEDELEEERVRSKEELEAFGRTLQGVDELRMVAESMSHRLKKYQTGTPSENIQFIDEIVEEDALGEEHLEEATKMLDSAKSTIAQKEEQMKDKPTSFWGIEFGKGGHNHQQHHNNKKKSTQMESHTNEEDIKKLVAVKKQKRSRKKKQRRGSGSSIVSSFF